MIAPSINVIGIGSGGGSSEGEVKRLRSDDRRRSGLCIVCSGDLWQRWPAIIFTLFGEIALQSTTVRFSGADVVPRRPFRAVIPAGELQASAIRLAVAIASRGGTILSIMSAWETSSQSSASRVILADFIRDVVDGLVIMFRQTQVTDRMEEHTCGRRRLSKLESRELGVVWLFPLPFVQWRVCQSMALAHPERWRKMMPDPYLQLPANARYHFQSNSGGSRTRVLRLQIVIRRKWR
jgi:hypothetical protein